MAGNDVFLYQVPSDASATDVRLRDPSTAASSGVAASSSQVFLLATSGTATVDVQAASALQFALTPAATVTVELQATSALVFALVRASAAQVELQAQSAVTLTFLQTAATTVELQAQSTVTFALSQTAEAQVSASGISATSDLVFAFTTDGAAEITGTPQLGDVDPGYWGDEWRKAAERMQPKPKVRAGVEPISLAAVVAQPFATVPSPLLMPPQATPVDLAALEDDEDEDWMLLAA